MILPSPLALLATSLPEMNPLPLQASTANWVPVAAACAMLMLAGFALLETGLGRAKNAANTMSMSFLVYPLAMVGLFVCGFAFMCGGIADPAAARVIAPPDTGATLNKLISLGGGASGILGARGFFLASIGRGNLPAWFFLITVCASIAATIPTGASVERWRFKSFFLFSTVMSVLIFPIYGCWVWGGGWLAQLGSYAHLGHGVVDFGGSSVIHLLGGGAALAVVLVLGPRLGKYDLDLNPRPILGHHVPMVILGTFLLAFGWFALNAARSLAADDGRAGLIAANTALCSAGGALAAVLYMWGVYGKPDPSIMCNGMLGGLVASSAGCAFFAPGSALLVGAIAGLVSAGGVLLIERRGIDDPAGALSVHGLNGVWGTLAVGLFADGTFGDGYNGVHGAVTGLLYGGGGSQLLCQLIAVAVCLVWAAGGSLLALAIIARAGGPNRVSPEVEIAGLDIPELGAPGYPEFISHVAPEQIPSSQILAARSRE